ncbi:MAG TPA: hypothetical protein ENG48_09300 [Candidatus Atribacteria bacterium]|nr:hypothetical protein [Candidatus Atribacteria bacterium]
MENIVPYTFKKDKLSASSIKTFLACKQNLLLYKTLQAKQEKIFFKYGTCMHYALEVFYKGEDESKIDDFIQKEIETWENQDIILEEEITELERQLRNLKNVFNAYKDWSKIVDKDLKVIDTEISFDIPFEGITLTGRVDLVVEDEMGGLWGLEHKTAAQFITEKYETDIQISLYTWALEKIYGKKFEGMIVNLIRKGAEPLTEVPRLKSGAITKDKSKLQKVPRDLLIKELQKDGADMNKYADILEKMKHENYFFKRYHATRSPKEIELFEDYLRDVIKDYTSTINYYPTPNFNCSNMCQFYDICKMYIKGYDYKSVLNELYVRREDKPNEENNNSKS